MVYGAAQSMKPDPQTRHEVCETSQAALDSLQEQLQALTILDGTALDWPGVDGAYNRIRCVVRDLVSCLCESAAQRDALDQELALAKRQERWMKDDIRRLNFNNSSLNKEVYKARQAQQEKRRCEEALAVQEERNAVLVANLEKSKKDMEFMDAEISALKKTVASQERGLKSLRDEAVEKERALSSLLTEAAQLGDCAKSTKEELESTRTELASCRVAVEDTTALRDSLAAELQQSQNANAHISGELRASQEEILRLRDMQKVLLRLGSEKLKEEKRRNLNGRDALAEKIQGLQRRIDAQNVEIESAAEKLRAKADEVTALRQTIHAMTGQASDLRAQTVAQQCEAKSERKAREACEKELMVVRNEQRMLAAHVSTSKETMARDKADLRAKVQDAWKDAAVQRTLADAWMREAHGLEGRLKEALERASGLESTVSSINEQLRSLSFEEHRRVAISERVAQDLRQQVHLKEADVRHRIEEAASEKEHSEKIIMRLREMNAALCNHIERLCDVKPSPLHVVQHEAQGLLQAPEPAKSSTAGGLQCSQRLRYSHRAR